MLFFTLPKNIQEKHFGKVVYKEIGEFVVRQEAGNERIINISASIATQRWVSFYANLNYKGAICHDPSPRNSWELFADDNSFIRQLKERNIKYFLWTEKTLSNNNVNIMKYNKYLKELGRWKHYDTGEMILFEVI